MKKLFVISLAILIAGCATFTQTALKSLYGADTLADTAMKSWAIYYHQATNNPAQFGETLAQVEQQHMQVNNTAREVGGAISTAHTMVDAYQQGLATKSQAQAAIDAAVASAPALIRLVATITGKTNLLANLPPAPATFTPIK